MSDGEAAIEDRIIADTTAVGYPGADSIRRCRVGRYVGVVDLVLLPHSGIRRLVMVEVNAEGHAKVIGQLLLYLTGALKIGRTGLDLMRQFARNNSAQALKESMTSLKMLAGGVQGPDRAWEALCDGDPLTLPEIHLAIGLDREPSRQLAETLALVADHGLGIDVIVAPPASRVHIWAAR